MPPRRDTPAPRPGMLMRAGLALLAVHRRAAGPLMLLHGLTGILLVALGRPFLGPDGELAQGDAVFLRVVLNFLHYVGAVGIGVVWARLVLVGPEAAFAGGWRVFLARWGQAVSRLASVTLLMVVLALPAVFAAAMAGHILALLLGGEAAQGFQLPLLMLALIPPAVIAATTLWLSIVGLARGAQPPFAETLRTAVEDWRRLAPVVLFAFLAAIGLLVLIRIAGSAYPALLDPTTLLGMGAQLLAAAVEMAFIMLVIGAFAQLPPPAAGNGG